MYDGKWCDEELLRVQALQRYLDRREELVLDAVYASQAAAQEQTENALLVLSSFKRLMCRTLVRFTELQQPLQPAIGVPASGLLPRAEQRRDSGTGPVSSAGRLGTIDDRDCVQYKEGRKELSVEAPAPENVRQRQPLPKRRLTMPGGRSYREGSVAKTPIVQRRRTTTVGARPRLQRGSTRSEHQTDQKPRAATDTDRKRIKHNANYARPWLDPPVTSSSKQSRPKHLPTFTNSVPRRASMALRPGAPAGPEPRVARATARSSLISAHRNIAPRSREESSTGQDAPPSTIRMPRPSPTLQPSMPNAVSAYPSSRQPQSIYASGAGVTGQGRGGSRVPGRYPRSAQTSDRRPRRASVSAQTIPRDHRRISFAEGSQDNGATPAATPYRQRRLSIPRLSITGQPPIRNLPARRPLSQGALMLKPHKPSSGVYTAPLSHRPLMYQPPQTPLGRSRAPTTESGRPRFNMPRQSLVKRLGKEQIEPRLAPASRALARIPEV